MNLENKYQELETKIIDLEKQIKELKEIISLSNNDNNQQTHLLQYPSSKAIAKEATIGLILEANGVCFEKEKAVPELGQQRFDYYLPDDNIMIEFDGIQHFQPVDYFGGEDTFALTKLRDQQKDEYCEANEIKLLRFRYNQTVNEVLEILQQNIFRSEYVADQEFIANDDDSSEEKININEISDESDDKIILNSVRFANEVGLDNILNRNLTDIWHEYRIWCQKQKIKPEIKINFKYELVYEFNLIVINNILRDKTFNNNVNYDIMNQLKYLIDKGLFDFDDIPLNVLFNHYTKLYNRNAHLTINEYRNQIKPLMLENGYKHVATKAHKRITQLNFDINIFITQMECLSLTERDLLPSKRKVLCHFKKILA